ncbi:MAG: hypothetical protein HMLKMBBP_00814 [Planctomycetes bacterium]|nr:hypothetical protein [Planctomycetota bacterium]
MAIAGLVVVSVMALAATFAGTVAPFDPRISESWETSLPPGARHLDLVNEFVVTAGQAPRERDVPPWLHDGLGDGHDHACELDVVAEEVKQLRVTMDGAKVTKIQGDGARTLAKVELGPEDHLRVKDAGTRIEAKALEPGMALPEGVPAKTGRWVLFAEWVRIAPDAKRTVRVAYGYGTVSAVTVAGAAHAGEMRIRAEHVRDLRVDGARKEHVHVLGTDLNGYDVLSRIIFGARISLLVGLVATLVSLSIGVLYGAVSGYAGGRTDVLMMRAVDVLYAMPYIFLVIVLLTVFDRNLIVLFVALGLVQWLTPARVVRGQILSIKRREFVDAAVTLGTTPWRILVRHLIPNTMGVVVVFTTLTIPAVILEESFLSFIGLTVKFGGEPIDSWGALVDSGRNALGVNGERWWMLVFPGAAMSLTLFSMNFLGDGLRDALDPRQKGRG